MCDQWITFRSSLAGVVTDVRILPTRIEWSVAGQRQVIEMMPASAISTVTISRAGYAKRILDVVGCGRSVRFRTTRAIAEDAKRILDERDERVVIDSGDAVRRTDVARPADDLEAPDDFEEACLRLLGF
ncbi:MAG: hypothetical protein ABIZ69_06960 [Ilumatobacteraceae bacterium]